MIDEEAVRSHSFFIGDLHLDPACPRPYQLALDFLAQVRHAKALYILGDLFEYWIGDDAGLPLYRDVIEALAALNDADCDVSVMLGNRDFLLGQDFANAAGVTLIKDDEFMITLDNAPVLLMHGDTLCTDDVSYQAFRRQVRDAAWQQAFLDKSIDERVAYATHLREQSQQSSADKTPELMDVTPSQVHSRLNARQSRTLIHGHTHRPDVHLGRHGDTRRLVVGDWHPDHACYVVNDASGLHLKRFTGQL